MEREIKVRVWDNNKTMLDWSAIMQTAFNRYNSEENKPDYGLLYRVFTNPDWVKMQYTGLKDKNGKEIYEGDIIQDNNYPEDGICNSVVTWDLEKGGWAATHAHAIEFDYHEIIGNIYENPELINQP